MPTCPGCQQRVSYQRLDAHQRYCHGLGTADDVGHRSIDRLESRVDDVERKLDGRLQAIERKLDIAVSAPDDGSEGRLLKRDL